MRMIILIDGYNLIKNILGSKHVSTAERTKFINEIAAYLKFRSLQAYIIFDGGQTTYPESNVHGVLTVVFSGYKQSADEYIVQYVATHKEYEILVVTDDRQLRDLIAQYKKHVLNTYDFYHQYVKADLTQRRSKNGNHDAVPIKTTSYESPALDELMQEASKAVVHKTAEEPLYKQQRTRGSKKERSRARILNKLRR